MQKCLSIWNVLLFVGDVECKGVVAPRWGVLLLKGGWRLRRARFAMEEEIVVVEGAELLADAHMKRDVERNDLGDFRGRTVEGERRLSQEMQ